MKIQIIRTQDFWMPNGSDAMAIYEHGGEVVKQYKKFTRRNIAAACVRCIQEQCRDILKKKRGTGYYVAVDWVIRYGIDDYGKYFQEFCKNAGIDTKTGAEFFAGAKISTLIKGVAK